MLWNTSIRVIMCIHPAVPLEVTFTPWTHTGSSASLQSAWYSAHKASFPTLAAIISLFIEGDNRVEFFPAKPELMLSLGLFSTGPRSAYFVWWMQLSVWRSSGFQPVAHAQYWTCSVMGKIPYATWFTQDCFVRPIRCVNLVALRRGASSVWQAFPPITWTVCYCFKLNTQKNSLFIDILNFETMKINLLYKCLLHWESNVVLHVLYML